MHYILAGSLVELLRTLPSDTKIGSICQGYHGDTHYLTVNDTHSDELLKIDLEYVSNREVADSDD